MITRRLAYLLLLAMMAAPGLGARQKVEPEPEIADLTVRTEGEDLWASYRLEGCLPEEVMERIQSGIPIRFRHKIEAVEKRPGLFAADRVFARTLIETRVEYDSLTQRYQLNRTLEVRSRQKRRAPPPASDQMVTGSIDEMQEWMTRVNDVPLGDPSRPFPPDVDLHVRVEPRWPERIAALSASHVEMLFAIGAGDLVVAGDLFSDHPAAAAGLPVLFGPVYDRWEARQMVQRGIGLEVEPDLVPSILSGLAGDPGRRADMGAEARLYVESGRGATEASARLVVGLLGEKPAT